MKVPAVLFLAALLGGCAATPTVVYVPATEPAQLKPGQKVLCPFPNQWKQQGTAVICAPAPYSSYPYYYRPPASVMFWGYRSW